MLHKLIVFFLDNNRYLDENRPYYYVAESAVLQASFEKNGTMKDTDYAHTYRIVNSFGHDYNKAEVVILDCGRVHTSAGDLKELTTIERASYVALTQSESTWITALRSKIAQELSNRTQADYERFESKSAPTNTQNVVTIKGESNMFDNLFKNLKMGPVTNGAVRMSMLGLAVASKDRSYVAFDKRMNDFVDATDFLVDGFDNYIYSIPVATKDIKPGDFIFHGTTPVRVVEVLENGNISAQNITEREVVTVIPVRNVFGFNFYAKIVSLFGDLFNNANDTQPFGNMLPLLLMNNGGSTGDMLPMMLAMNGMNGSGTMNPMLMMAMLNKGSGNDMLPLLLMSQGGQNIFGDLFGGITTVPAAK